MTKEENPQKTAKVRDAAQAVPEENGESDKEAAPAPTESADAETAGKEKTQPGDAPAEEKKETSRAEKKGLFAGKSEGKSIKEAEKALKEAEKALKEAEKARGEAEKRIKELTDRAQRSLAEFDNFRKRTGREKSAMYDIGARSVVEKLLPVVDSFERGLGGLTEEQKAEPFAAGMEKVYRQLQKMLADLDVQPIEAVGQTFNPDLHSAVMHVEDESAGENVVVEEFQKGYTYKGTVVRYSMVKVAN